MWRFVLTVSLLCWGSEGTVTCRNNNNGAVDWYILYKAPKTNTLTGLEYLYVDSTNPTRMIPSAHNMGINHPAGVLANTLRPLFTPVRSMPRNFGFLSYSDQPPGCNAFQEFGHSKGVLLVDGSGTGVWLLHSTPQFPFRRDQNHFWPDSGVKNAQIFICVTFPYHQFKLIGEHLQYIRAFPFEHDIPPDFHQELRDAVNWVQKPPPEGAQELISSQNNVFYSIAKQQSPQPRVGDLYVTIAQGFGSDLDVQTWGCQPDHASSYCVRNQFKVLNIKTIHTPLVDWNPTRDHSKWCVTKDKSRPFTCIADVNRATTQYERRGGALCMNNAAIANIFQGFAGGNNDCTSEKIMDYFKADCETDSNTDPLTDTHMEL